MWFPHIHNDERRVFRISELRVRILFGFWHMVSKRASLVPVHWVLSLTRRKRGANKRLSAICRLEVLWCLPARLSIHVSGVDIATIASHNPREKCPGAP
jgi:hypothetical protein